MLKPKRSWIATGGALVLLPVVTFPHSPVKDSESDQICVVELIKDHAQYSHAEQQDAFITQVERVLMENHENEFNHLIFYHVHVLDVIDRNQEISAVFKLDPSGNVTVFTGDAAEPYRRAVIDKTKLKVYSELTDIIPNAFDTWPCQHLDIDSTIMKSILSLLTEVRGHKEGQF